MSNIKSVDSATAYEWIESGEAIVIDVREPAEYAEAHIPGSHLIPLGNISENLLPIEAKNKKIIVHCKMGKRGSFACEKLLSENENLDIYNLSGGIIAWENAGYTVECAR